MFKKALKRSALQLRHLEREGKLAQFALIGGFAVARWGIARATADIDYVIKLGSCSLQQIAEKLGGKCHLGDIHDSLLGAVSFEILCRGGAIPVQLLQLPPAWETVAFHDVEEQVIEKVSIPFVDWKALVLLKLYAGSALDLEDAKQILDGRQISKVERHYLRSKACALRVSKRLLHLL